jgi:hypothetical protein
MARLHDEFVRKVHRSTFTIEQLCRKVGWATRDNPNGVSTLFFHYMPRRRARRRVGERRLKARGPVGAAPKPIPRARWSKVRKKILAMAKILKVPASRVFVEDDD